MEKRQATKPRIKNVSLQTWDNLPELARQKERLKDLLSLAEKFSATEIRTLRDQVKLLNDRMIELNALWVIAAEGINPQA